MQVRDEQTPDHMGRKEKPILSRPNRPKKGELYTKCHEKAPSKERCPQTTSEPSACKAKYNSHLGQCHWSPGSNQGHSPPSLTSRDFPVSIYEMKT